MIRRIFGEENSHFGSLGDFDWEGKVFRLLDPSVEDTEPLRRCRDDTEDGRSCMVDDDASFFVHRT